MQRRRIDELLLTHGIGEMSEESAIDMLRAMPLDQRSMFETQLIIYTHGMLSEHVKGECLDIKALERSISCLVKSVDKYKPYLELLVEREKSKAVFRKAVIEKTATGLVWSFIAALGWLIYEGVKQWVKFK